MTAEHNYNKDCREAMYAWMARWLQDAPIDVHPAERSFSPEPPASLLVFHQRALPSNAVDVARLTDDWIAAAKRQRASGDASVFSAALRHALGFAGDSLGSPKLDLPPKGGSHKDSRAGGDNDRRDGRTVLLGAPNPELERALGAAGLRASVIPFTRFDSVAAGKIHHFETYNRTAASQRVADIVTAVRAHPGAALIADGDAGLAGLLA